MHAHTLYIAGLLVRLNWKPYGAVTGMKLYAASWTGLSPGTMGAQITITAEKDVHSWQLF